jgi:predicted transposase YbfD/YdcC
MLKRPLSSSSTVPVSVPASVASVTPAHLQRLHAHFENLPDPRLWREVSHPLGSILFIALCAVLCGADSFAEMALYGRTRAPWLRTIIPLGTRGTPSHDTFNRVLSALHWHDFEGAVRAWTRTLLPPGTPGRESTPEQYCLDGKVQRGSRTTDPGSGKKRWAATVNVWAAAHGLVLDQRRIPEEGSEITALQLLLRHLHLAGTVVSMDAAHAQQETLGAIITRGGDYLVSLKENQPTAHAEVTALLDAAARERAPDFTNTDKGHGRVDTRRLWIVSEVSGLATRGRWKGLRTLVLCERESYSQSTGKTTTGRRYYLSSLAAEAKVLAACVRRHWQVEASVHWVLDVVFREDTNRARSGYAATNLSLLRKIALNLLRRHGGEVDRTPLKGRRLKAALDPAYLAEVIAPILSHT